MNTHNYLLIYLLLISYVSSAQPFSKINPQNSVGVAGRNAWLDFDNDGDLDFIIAGGVAVNELRTILYVNTGNDVFQQAPSPFHILPQYGETPISLLNLNGDERIDILLMGRRIGDASTQRISLLENQPTGFTDLGPLPDFGSADGYGTIATGDVNNDGTTDVFVSGINGYVDGNPSIAAFLYLNVGGALVKSSNTSFIGVYLSDSKFVDIDKDQDLDLIVCGFINKPPYQHTSLYINDGSGNFELTPSGFEPLQNSSIDAADYDADGDPDILFTGFDEYLTVQTKLYKNNNGQFEEVTLNTELNRTYSGSATWGDYDNDGDPDILISGNGGESPFKLAIFQNKGGDQFESVQDPAFEVLGSAGTASWGDYDSDGDLDILVTGYNASDIPSTYILKNNSTSAKNTKPAAPTLSLEVLSTQSCQVTWSGAHDEATPTASLTYNLSVKDVATDKYIQYPFSDKESGKRKVNESGNMGWNAGKKLNNLPTGTFSIKVQAIDGGFLGSGWSSEKRFYSGLPAAPTNASLTFNNGTINLTWTDHSNNEEFFVIERKTNHGVFEKFDSTTSNSVTFSDPYSGFNMYEYRVRAVNPNNRSSYTNSVQTSLDSPTSLMISSEAGNVILKWTDNSYSEQFFVIERRQGDEVFVKIDSVSSNATTFTEPLSEANLYEYRVYATNPLQKSSYTNTVTFIIAHSKHDLEKESVAYPNPVSNNLVLLVEKSSDQSIPISVINSTGRVIVETVLSLDEHGMGQLDLSAMPPGIYFIKYSTVYKEERTIKIQKI